MAEDTSVVLTGHIDRDLYTAGHSGDINYMQTPLQEYLRKHNACKEARVWVGPRTLKDAWNACHSSEWMEWLVDTVDGVQCTCYTDGRSIDPDCPSLLFREAPDVIREKWPYERLRKLIDID